MKHIFLADDDMDDCFFFKDALDELNLPVELTVVNDGEQLMHTLSQPASKLPDVIFMDLNMPRKNGYSCLREIKASESLSAIPVVIFSTSYDEYVAEELYNTGAHYYIRKPTEFGGLKLAIASTVSLLQASREQPKKEKFLIPKRYPAR